MNVAYLCLGGNIGDREKALDLAILKIKDIIGQITSLSNIYETQAWGVDNQQAYLNQCIMVKTNFNALSLIDKLLLIEKELGRERTINASYEPRTIDIDILFFNQEVINLPQLIIPHPRLHLRDFVLIPLSEIAPNYLHPLLNKTIFSLLTNSMDASDVKLFKR